MKVTTQHTLTTQHKNTCYSRSNTYSPTPLSHHTHPPITHSQTRSLKYLLTLKLTHPLEHLVSHPLSRNTISQIPSLTSFISPHLLSHLTYLHIGLSPLTYLLSPISPPSYVRINECIARLRVATEGGFEALMMISMVRSVDLQTKLLCVIALCNLLDDCTVDYILQEGLVGSVANLSKISDSDTTHLCATLMNQLTYYLPARLNIAEKVPIVVVEHLLNTPLNTPSQYTLSIHPLNTSSQHTLFYILHLIPSHCLSHNPSCFSPATRFRFCCRYLP